MLILAVRLLNVNQLLCPGWVSDTAPLSAQYMNENHVLSDSSLCAVGLQIMNKWHRDHESRPHSCTLCVQASESPPARCLRHSPKIHKWVAAVPLLAGMLAAELNWTKKQISSWSDSVQFVHSNIHSFDSNNTFATETTLACSAPHCHGSREVSISECNVLLRRVEVHRYCVLATTIHTISHVTFLAFYYSIISILYTLVQYP